MEYDAIIIGAGQAGPGLAIHHATKGDKTAMIEGDLIGGTCLNYGCRPTKALRASARVAHIARRGAAFGVQTGDVTVDFPAVMGRMRGIIGGMQKGFWDYINNLENLDVIHAYGKFIGSENGVHKIQAGDNVLESSRVYINVGARAFVPPIPGIGDVPHLTNKELLELNDLPSHLIIIGGGYIGLEFGQMFRRFGSQVTVIEGASHVLSREDEDVSEAVEELLRGEGVTILTDHRAQNVSGTAGDIHVELSGPGGTHTVTGSHLLVATGRTPNSDSLNLESVGLQTNERGFITTNGRFETNVPGIWALGDVNGRGAFTHTAYQDYEILLDESRTADARTMAYAVFTDPPVGRVGMNEREARESGLNVLTMTAPMSSVSRAQLDSDTTGLVKIFVDADSEKIIGGLVFGMQGDDVISVVSNFMATGASYKVMKNALPIHPSISEFFPTWLGALQPMA